MRTTITVLLTAALVAPLAWWLGRQPQATTPAPVVVAAPSELYVCPMHPQVTSHEPGNCPICKMRLVKQTPAAPEPSNDELATVEIDLARQQLLGVQTQPVESGQLGGALRTVGRVSVDETRVRRVNVKVAGYVEHVYVDFVGKPVKKGQPLFSLYSPDILAAENELLAALRSSSAPLVAAAKKKLELWDVPDTELQRLEREGTPSRTITLASPASGVVTKKEVVEGARLEVGAMPYEVTDLSTVWVLAEIYETELRFVTPGLAAHLELTSLPGRGVDGTVLFVDPVLDPKTRTAKARLAFPNPKGELKPEMFGEVRLERAARTVLRAPSDALVRTGQEDVVFVALGGGRFEPRRVTVGEEGRDFVEVLEGLHEGERVVSRGTFLVDSESRLRASLLRSTQNATPAGSGAAP